MRVLVTATSLTLAYGGPAFSVSRLARALAEAGLQTGIWAADGSAVNTPLLADRPGRLEVLGGGLHTAFGQFRPELVHDNGLWLAHNHALAAAASRSGLPRVVSPRGMLEPWARRHKRWKKAAAWALYQKRDLQSAAALHATSAAEADNLRGLGLSATVCEIPNGMDLPDAELPAKTRAGAVRTALFLGRLYPVKGLPMLVEAWAAVRPRGWRLVIAGPDEAGHGETVRAAVARAGLADVISFTGAVDGQAKRALFDEAELFILPSHSESFGMAIAEALAHGAPVLTTTAAPWPMLRARGCGWQVRPDAQALAEGLRTATACDAPSLRAMGAAGRALIAADFGWSRVADQFVALYGRLARRTPGPLRGAPVRTDGVAAAPSI